jgi:hypothetical protein
MSKNFFLPTSDKMSCKDEAKDKLMEVFGFTLYYFNWFVDT